MFSNDGRAVIGNKKHQSIADVWGRGISGVDHHESARRLCAAWNACSGIPTEDLEVGAKRDNTHRNVKSLTSIIDMSILAKLKAENEQLKQCLKQVIDTGLNGGNNVRQTLEAALAKIEQ